METRLSHSSSPEKLTLHPQPAAEVFQSNIGSGKDTLAFEIPSPPKELFRGEIGSGSEQVAFEDNHPIPIINRIDYPETGGVFIYWKGWLYPHKGLQFPEAVFATNVAKRMMVSVFKFLASPMIVLPLLGFLFSPWPLKRRIVLHSLQRFQEAADVILGPYYLKDRFWMLPAKELNLLVTRFFYHLGMETRIGDICAMFIEYDTAYCMRFQDIMGETDGEKLMRPITELKRLFSLFCEREPDPLIRLKFKGIIRILTIFLCLPRVRWAFKKAVKEVNIENFWCTEADEYHVLPLKGYDFSGIPFIERLEIFMDIHRKKGVPLPHHEYKTQRPKPPKSILSQMPQSAE